MLRRQLKTHSIAFLGCLFGTVSAAASLTVNFDEGAPKDKFRIENTGSCKISGSTVVLDLSASAAGLIFDVTGKGAGVEVYQPFEIVEGKASLAAIPSVRDGQSSLELQIADLSPGQAIAFTIDVDDTKGQRAITVSGSEIEGARVALKGSDKQSIASFSANAVARLAVSGC